MVEAIAALLALLATILPPLVAHWVERSAEKKQDDQDLQRHSLDELHIGGDRVRQDHTPPV